MNYLKNKILVFIASVCIKLLSIDSVRVFFITNVLYKLDLDDIIDAMKKKEDAKRKKQ